MRWRSAIGGTLAVALAGCGSDAAPPPAVCSDSSPTAVEAALAAAPAPVRLAGGTRLSRCVAAASGQGDLVNVGSVLTGVADDLARRAGREHGAATELGYLIGAVRLGAAHATGVADELVRRIERSAAALGSGPDRAALDVGIRAGRSHG